MFVCLQDISKRGWIRMKFGGQVGFVRRSNYLDFGEDPAMDLDTRIFKVILHH